MDMKRLAIGTIVGGITLFAVGYVIFDVATASFYAENLIDVDSAYRDTPDHLLQALGNLALGALVTLGILSRPGTPTVTSGLLTGALIGFLVWLGADLTLVSLTNVWNSIIVFIDPLFEGLHHGIAGAVIAAVLARVPNSAMRSAE
jgi:hypothetical protein